MATLFVVMIILTGYHYFIENVIVPVHKMSLMNELIQLKRNLAIIHKKHSVNLSDDLVIDMTMKINGLITNNDQYTFSRLFFSMKNISKDENDAIMARSKEFVRQINNCSVPEFTSLADDFYKIIRKSFVINHVAWIIYLLPFVIIFIMLKQINSFHKKIREWFKVKVFTITTNENNLEINRNKYPKNSNKGQFAY